MRTILSAIRKQYCELSIRSSMPRMSMLTQRKVHVAMAYEKGMRWDSDDLRWGCSKEEQWGSKLDLAFRSSSTFWSTGSSYIELKGSRERGHHHRSSRACCLSYIHWTNLKRQARRRKWEFHFEPRYWWAAKSRWFILVMSWVFLVMKLIIHQTLIRFLI